MRVNIKVGERTIPCLPYPALCGGYPNLSASDAFMGKRHWMQKWRIFLAGGEEEEDKGLRGGRGGGNQSIDEMDVCFPWGEGRMFPKQSPDNWVIEGFVGVVVIDAASKQEGILCWVDRKTSFIN